MYQACVLIGRFTQRASETKEPATPHDEGGRSKYDSVVDNVDNPTKFFMFHAALSYPEYLITFKSAEARPLPFRRGSAVTSSPG